MNTSGRGLSLVSRPPVAPSSDPYTPRRLMNAREHADRVERPCRNRRCVPWSALGIPAVLKLWSAAVLMHSSDEFESVILLFIFHVARLHRTGIRRDWIQFGPIVRYLFVVFIRLVSHFRHGRSIDYHVLLFRFSNRLQGIRDGPSSAKCYDDE